MALYRCNVILNGKVRGHYLEDAKAIAAYDMYPAEPDVGIIEPYVEFEFFESESGRMLPWLTLLMDSSMYEDILDQISYHSMVE